MTPVLREHSVPFVLNLRAERMNAFRLARALLRGQLVRRVLSPCFTHSRAHCYWCAVRTSDGITLELI